MSRRLVALDLPGGPTFVESLQQAWENGDAVLPVDQRLPVPARRELLDLLRPHVVVTPNETKTRPDGIECGPDDAVVVATSGSTGTPKGVVLTHSAVAASARATSSRLGITSHDHWLACLPLSHVGGLSVVLRALWAGTELTVLPRFEPAAVTDAARGGANRVSLVATALGRIDPMLFETIVLGGSTAPTDRPPNTVTTYGMTETGSGVVYDRRPLDTVEVRTVSGEIQLRAPMLLRCYRSAATDMVEVDPRLNDGWFATGDLGTVHDDGTVEVFGRRSDLIITGGENVWPEAVESVLAGVDGVSDVIVAGTPDPEWGAAVTAHVVCDAGATVSLDALRDATKAVLPAYCAPQRVVYHSKLPRTALGKPQRHRL